MELNLNVILYVLAALASLAQAQSYRYRYGRRRTSRPASRLFGSNFQGSGRSRYDSGRRPASRRFSIPGFESAFGSSSSSGPSSSNFQNLGFNLGFGGPAFVDPIAGMYDTVNVQDGGGGGFGQGSIVGLNDFASMNPAANTRASFSRESNTAMDPSAFNSRQQQNNMGAHDSYLGAGGLGLQNVNLGFSGNQDSTQFFTTSGGNSGGFTALDLSSAATNNLRSQLGRAVPTQNPLGAGQLNSMGAMQFIDASAMELAGLGSQNARIQAALNRFEMPGSGLVDSADLHGLMSGHNQVLQNQLAIDTAQLGLNSNQLGMGLEGAQLGLDNKQLGLGQNNILLDTNSLGLDGNHVIIQSDQMDMANLGQSALSAGNQILLDPSGGEMNILGNEIGLGNSQSLINNNHIGGDLRQLTGELNAASALQGQMNLLSTGEGGSTQILTATGDFPAGSLTSQTLTSQVGLGSSNQFFSPQEEEQFVGQQQNAGQVTSQLNSGLLNQLTGA